ncbi:MAG: hypothetical protein ABI716_03335 [Candidatus Saccharibacteria bacterium]
MAEILPELNTEQCLHCPDRNRLSHLLASIAGKAEIVSDCDGPVTVSRGTIVTQETKAGEPSPDKSSWNIKIGKLNGPQLFSRIDWIKQVDCGKSAIEAGEDELVYPHPDGQLIHRLDGKRYAAFYKGSAAGFRADGLIRAFATLDNATDASTKD